MNDRDEARDQDPAKVPAPDDGSDSVEESGGTDVSEADGGPPD